MSTIERINNRVYFQVENKMITKTNKGWYDSNDNKVSRNLVNNLVNCKTHARQAEVIHVKSILNRHFNGKYKFK